MALKDWLPIRLQLENLPQKPQLPAVRTQLPAVYSPPASRRISGLDTCPKPTQALKQLEKGAHLAGNESKQNPCSGYQCPQRCKVDYGLRCDGTVGFMYYDPGD